MRPRLIIFAFAVTLCVLQGCRRSEPADAAERPIVGITQIASHPSLDQVREGIVRGLAERGFEDGETVQIIFRNANGDPSLTLPIAQDFVRQGVDVLVPITTPSALGAARTADTTPIVFGGVTDPVGVGLVASLDSTGANITGTSDRWPFSKQLDLFTQLLPEMRTLGYLYRPGDDVSSVALDSMRVLAPRYGLELIAEPVSSPADVYPTAVALLRRTDALYTGLDNLVVENLESVFRAAEEAGKPVLAGDVGSVERGALATYSISMLRLGEITGHMVADVLEGASPADMPVQVVSEGHGYVNRAAAEELGLNLARIDSLGVDYFEEAAAAAAFEAP